MKQDDKETFLMILALLLWVGLELIVLFWIAKELGIYIPKCLP